MSLSKERYLQLHEKFLEVRSFENIPHFEFLNLDTYRSELNDSFSIVHWPVIEDLGGGIIELLSWINHFAFSIRDIHAWAQVLDDIEDRAERFAVVYEIITPAAFFSLAFAAAIKGKLIFVAEKMVRDTFNVTRDNGKTIEDYELGERIMSTFARQVTQLSLKAEWDSFVASLQEIDDDRFRSVTSNYRNRANHQITPNLEVGERFVFAPTSEPGIEGFTFGIERAISLSALVEPLCQQQAHCCRAFETFWPIVLRFRDHWAGFPQ